MDEPDTTTLYRPVGEKELALIQTTGFTQFPPRLPGQPIFYPVLAEEYARQIARDWNAQYNQPRVGYVTRFRPSRYLKRYDIHTVGGSIHQDTGYPQKT